MSVTRMLLAPVAVAGLLVLGPLPAASAHVHGINPLNCTPAPDNAGANQTNETPATSDQGGPLPTRGVIPIAMGGNVDLRGGDFFGVCQIG